MIRSYIDRQEEHHGTRTYKEELLSLLADHGVEYDLKYFV